MTLSTLSYFLLPGPPTTHTTLFSPSWSVLSSPPPCWPRPSSSWLRMEWNTRLKSPYTSSGRLSPVTRWRMCLESKNSATGMTCRLKLSSSRWAAARLIRPCCVSRAHISHLTSHISHVTGDKIRTRFWLLCQSFTQ